MQLLPSRTEQRHRAVRKLLKNWNHQRNAIVEDSHPALQERLGIAGKRQQKPRPWRGVSRLRNGVVIKAQSEADGEPGNHRPLIAGKPRGLVLADIERGWLSKGDALDRRVGGVRDRGSQECLSAVVSGMSEIESRLEFVLTKELKRSELIGLLPFDPGSAACLAAEESSFCCIWQKAIGLVALRRHVGVKLLEAELRNEKAPLSSQVAVLCINLITAL